MQRRDGSLRLIQAVDHRDEQGCIQHCALFDAADSRSALEMDGATRRSRHAEPMPFGSAQTNSSEKAAADRGSRRIWPQVQAWRQLPAFMGAFKTRDASREITVMRAWRTCRRFLHLGATAAGPVRLSHINPSYNHDLRCSSMKRAFQVSNKRAKPRVLGYP